MKATSLKNSIAKNIITPSKIKTAPQKTGEALLVVAIGASAGGLDALEQFFKLIPINNNMAFVVITHLNPEHKSIMPELIQKHTVMPVFVIKNGLPVKPNTVYVIPPNKNVSIKNNLLSLTSIC